MTHPPGNPPSDPGGNGSTGPGRLLHMFAATAYVVLLAIAIVLIT